MYLDPDRHTHPAYSPVLAGPAWADRTRDDAAERQAEHQAQRHHATNFQRAVLPADMAAPVRFEPPVTDHSARDASGKPTLRPLRVEELVYEELATQDGYAAWFGLVLRAAGGEDVRAEAGRVTKALAWGYAERKAREEAGV